jgi:hypothetical protein
MDSMQATTIAQTPPKLTVNLDEKTVPMTVHAIWIAVQIAGTVSRTTLVPTCSNRIRSIECHENLLVECAA